ncbi:MAG: SDR family NAD(P)-dependent oxidoreductase, partial [Proteobacteria bacterium]|nr:SDR family NAD(P)-dependent oxidoreductase [Pseudomonadota bacterium]
MDLGISGKRALVLASSQGLGLGVATKLCEEGARLLLSSRSEEKLAAAAGSLNESGPGEAEYAVAD